MPEWTWTQEERPIQITTPLGKDKVLVKNFRAREALNELFHFEVNLVGSPDEEFKFDQLLGQKVTIKLEREAGTRYYNGIVHRMSAGGRDFHFQYYRLELVPQFWLLTRKRTSRIFQQKTTPDILKKILEGLDVSYELQGTFHPSEYRVQYQETDFEFASRLMEDEGIYYFFKHSDGGHKMVLANTPQSHPDVPYLPTVKYEEIFNKAEIEENRVFGWKKTQKISTGKVTTWDEHFQLPGKHLDGQKSIMDTLQVGTVSHNLKAGGADGFEIYEFPGTYSRIYDGINKGGGDQADHLQWIFDEATPVADLRMQEEAARSVLIECKGVHTAFMAGHTFTMKEHFNSDGKYTLISVEHQGQQPLRIGGEAGVSDVDAYEYKNQFTCIPFALPYKPERTTPPPSIRGLQTAIVVGPPGEEIYTDKYARVKVQFRWDRDGKNDVDSSCWMRVASFWAGKKWGGIHIPRIGHEVLVDFEEGDVDHPIIVGSVYNADNMPPYKLPDNKTQSGVKSHSTLKGSDDNFNEIRFEDKKGSEEVYMHAEKDWNNICENNQTAYIGKGPNREEGSRTETVYKDETLTIETGNRKETIKMGNDSLEISMGNRDEAIKMGNDTLKIDLGYKTEEAMQYILMTVGQSSIKIDQMGVTIKGMMIKVEGQVMVDVDAPLTTVKGDAMLTLKGGITMIN
jgi:type VI secretion system secreted protein VgrG